MTRHNANHSLAASFIVGCVLLLAVFIILALVNMANAHMAAATPEQPFGWQYGWDCCSLQDCRPVSAAEIEEGPEGFVVKATGELIPYTDRKVKQSKDQYFHLCTRGGKPDGAAICLYVPNRGF